MATYYVQHEGYTSLEVSSSRVYRAGIAVRDSGEIRLPSHVDASLNIYSDLPLPSGSMQESGLPLVMVGERGEKEKLTRLALAINIAASAAVAASIIGVAGLLAGKPSLAVLGIGSGLTYLAMLVKLLSKAR